MASKHPHGYEYDLFVSYSTRDLQWVRPFHDDLVAEVNRFTNPDVFPFLDKTRLLPGYVWNEKLLAAARNSAVLVPVLSPRFFESDYCQKEVQAFVVAHGLTSGAAHRSRIMPVKLLCAAPVGHVLAEAQAAIFCRDDGGGVPFDYDPGTPEYKKALRELAFAVAEVLKSLPPNRGMPTREEELRYLARLIEETEEKARLYSPLHGIAQARSSGPAAPALLRAWKDDPDLALLRHNARSRESAEYKSETRDYDDILTAFGEVRRAALLGAPGSGKSTTLRKLAIDLAQRARDDPRAPLPLLAALGNWRGDEPLAAFVAGTAPEIGWAMEALSKAGRLVLLLDGLNEVPTAKRAAKAADVRELQERIEPGTPVIVSCRREDYTGDLDLGLDTLTLEPLSPQRIRAAVRQWVTAGGEPAETADRFFWQLAGDERLAGVLEKWVEAGASEDTFWSASGLQEHDDLRWRIGWRESELWTLHIPNPRSLVRLASNPFMLTMLFQVWAGEGELPKNRGDLFGRFINRLLSREGLLVHDKATGEWRMQPEGKRLLAGLAGLAWRMQHERIRADDEKRGDFGVLTVVSRGAVLDALGGEPLVKKALDSTLLEGVDELRFRHQLLQEYFTAQALQVRLGETKAEEFWPPDRWWARSGWEEVAVLLAGLYSDCTPVIRWLAEAQPETAAQCILESGVDVANSEALLGELQLAWMPRLTGGRREAQPEARAAIGRALGRLGLDNRKGVGVKDGVPDIDWVEIPSGEFIYQEGERRRVDRFFMARYPITNAQYQAFVEAEDGYRADRWWKGLTNPDRTPERSYWSEANHPRETVSWYEAMAFCGWLGQRLGYEVRLPTEWEWERAALGTDGRGYPWGKEYLAGHANINERWDDAGPHNLRRTSAVGVYAEGASREGVLDLSGNVWEWCLNEYEKPDREQRGGKESRVLRGGSWLYILVLARADLRYHYRPLDRSDDIGFRVVCSAPIR